MMNKIVLASNNQGKLAEFSRLFRSLNIEIVPQSVFNITECPEPYVTFVENALAKARHASRHSGLPALADDSGICANALHGAPGVHSARYAGTEPKSDAANNAKLDAQLRQSSDKSVFYVCVLVLVRHPDDPQPLIAEANWAGLWQSSAVGNNGFGYDPHFYLPEQQLTAAQMSQEEKNRISHRAQALHILMAKLQQQYGLNSNA
ncbi:MULTISPECIES: non-canonical purine NTP pyrophosphatase [Snodgrassella]|uniref:non-canonical purine NTP pyrophosphatase n=1 Tax=Snodgrassella TaxID=1193515 RepID=UPI001EF6C20D|nr:MULTISPECIES: non-canonical purine NTP pyrophosphatase [Snodgrassella]MCO6518817.1 non-canonical purine NTP pyrophosphatase [Snodgrassella sp.]